MSQYVKIIITALIGAAGGIVFALLHFPVAWLLGPLTFVLIANFFFSSILYWPKSIKSVGMILIGYTIGLALTGQALKEIGKQLPYMFTMTMLLILLCAGIAYIVTKLSKINYATALLSSIPGGMTQIIIMAEEIKTVNLTIVTVTQTIRLLMIVIGMPLVLRFLGSGHYTTSESDATALFGAWLNWQTLVVLVLCAAFAVIGKKIKFPTAFLLVPAIVTAIAQGSGLHPMELPNAIIQLAQFLIGINIALMMQPKQLENKAKTISLAVMSGALLFVTAMGLGLVFAHLNELDLPTALLSLAPGGMDQMGAIAHAIHADLSLVAGYQVFRAFFILLIIQPLLVLILRKMKAI